MKMGFQCFCLLLLLLQQLHVSAEKGKGEKVLVVLDLDETLIHQHKCKSRYCKGHDKLCTRAVENGKWCGSMGEGIDDLIHFCIREGALEFLEKLESLRKEEKLDILIWTRMPSPNAVVHVTTLAHYAGISSQLSGDKGTGRFQLDGKGDIYSWGLISDGSSSKDLLDLKSKDELEAKDFALNNMDKFDKTLEITLQSYWKHGFNTDAIIENVKNGVYGQTPKNIYIFDDNQVNCLSDEINGVSIKVPTFKDTGDNFFELFIKTLEENEAKQFESDGDRVNRLFDTLLGSEFFQEPDGFKTAFAKTTKTIKEMISENKIGNYSQRKERTTFEAPLTPIEGNKTFR